MGTRLERHLWNATGYGSDSSNGNAQFILTQMETVINVMSFVVADASESCNNQLERYHFTRKNDEGDGWGR